ncbi:MAG: glycosyltransferase family 2 protein [Spirochaetota bacterium]|nr:glycosyltransferase family 2 protein [Spirochaetota bacterium]
MAISVSIICFNEEQKIRRCLESVKWADEIVILDSFSTDATLKICSEYTNKIFKHEFDGHIQQKNRALELCSYNWVFCIDADEVISSELKESVLSIDLEKTGFKGFYVSRKVFYLGKWIHHGGWYPDYKIRFFDRRSGRWEGINPHDTVVVNGRISRLKGDLLHYSYQNVSAHLRQIDKFTDIMAFEYEKNGKKPSIINLTLRPFYKFIKMFFIKLGFLDGLRGFIIAILGAFYVFMKFVKLYERKILQKDK